jgi:hypothetical protein
MRLSSSITHCASLVTDITNGVIKMFVHNERMHCLLRNRRTRWIAVIRTAAYSMNTSWHCFYFPSIWPFVKLAIVPHGPKK